MRRGLEASRQRLVTLKVLLEHGKAPEESLLRCFLCLEELELIEPLYSILIRGNLGVMLAFENYIRPIRSFCVHANLIFPWPWRMQWLNTLGSNDRAPTNFLISSDCRYFLIPASSLASRADCLDSVVLIVEKETE
jgi:hypothetical protein